MQNSILIVMIDGTLVFQNRAWAILGRKSGFTCNLLKKSVVFNSNFINVKCLL